MLGIDTVACQIVCIEYTCSLQRPFFMNEPAWLLGCSCSPVFMSLLARLKLARIAEAQRRTQEMQSEGSVGTDIAFGVETEFVIRERQPKDRLGLLRIDESRTRHQNDETLGDFARTLVRFYNDKVKSPPATKMSMMSLVGVPERDLPQNRYNYWCLMEVTSVSTDNPPPCKSECATETTNRPKLSGHLPFVQSPRPGVDSIDRGH